MANRINNKDINLISSYKTYNNKGKSSPLKKLLIIFICLALVGDIALIGYISQNKITNLQNEIQVINNYLNDEDNILQNSRNAELNESLEDLRTKVSEINEVLTTREASVKVNQNIINDISASIGANDKITSIAYNRADNSLNVSFTLTGEISSYNIIRNLKSKSKFKDVQYNMYQYDESKLQYQMSVTISLTDGKE